ncbi:hypothetical protein JG687_00010888 [Phytophthora cactorum]|uniref:Uncharacterized protein n=1 Tax=Phytophthora cactorum TaxID=29920 RepID=A0A8T1U9W0_9STRA|nr:hypothetical protein JG687_00010888 [Phytophthora cactorum]
MARRRAPLSRLLLLVVLLVRVSLAENFADLTISARMKQLINTGIEAPKLKLNTTLPLAVQYLLNQNDLAWRDLGGTMQRLVLWDQGYVVTSSNKTREILVRCDLGMDDVVVSREEFESLRNCPSTLCTDPASSEIVLRGTICADSEIEKVAKCAVLVSESEATAASVDVETNLIWAEEVTNTDVPMPTVHLLQKRKQSSGTRELVEKSTLDHYALTPGGGFFVGTNDSNDATDSISSELSGFEIERDTEVLLLFQNDPIVHALRVPILDVNGDKMISPIAGFQT